MSTGFFIYLNEKQLELINVELQMTNIEDLGNKFNLLKENDFDVCDINDYINSENKCQELITEDEEALNIEEIMNIEEILNIVTKTTEIIEDNSTDTSYELTRKDNDLNIPVDKCSIIKEVFKSFNSLKANLSLCSPDASPDLYKLNVESFKYDN